MTSNEPVQITVVLVGRPYPIVIDPADEPIVLRLVNEVNQSAQHFMGLYPNRDKQDHLAMTALALAVELNKARLAGDPALPSKLNQLEEQLGQILQA
jgi:cell division protein ZapA (FtsZ GTPase activity inhibitor)